MLLLPRCLVWLCVAGRARKPVGVDAGLIADGFEGKRVRAGEDFIHQEDVVRSTVRQPLTCYMQVSCPLEGEFALGVRNLTQVDHPIASSLTGDSYRG